MDRETQPLDLTAIKSKLAQARGPQYWRTLSELAETPDFIEALVNEVPQAARTTHLNMDRRQFLTLAGASLALAGVSGCRYLPQQKLVPYVKQPEELTVGLPLYYATAAPNIGGYGVGAIVTSREGRPIKMEGNPGHPDSLGASDVWVQAATLALYDPERAQVVYHQGEFSSWQEFYDSGRAILDGLRSTGGAGLRILTETITSATLANQIKQVLARFPNAQWVQYEPTGRDSVRAGARAAFGQPVSVHYRLDSAQRIVSLDADFLLTMPGHIRYAHDFIQGRKIRLGTKDMNRLYVIESSLSITGAMADHRLPVRASQVEGIARALAARLGVDGITAAPNALDAATTKLLDALVKDLQAHQGSSVVIPGDCQTPAVHALAHAINEKLGAVGQTVVRTEPIEAAPDDQMSSLKKLVTDMKAGNVVEMLLILGGNPIYNTPPDLDFKDALNSVPFRAHLSHYVDETSIACQWSLPESHFLEAWGDIRGYDGVTSIIQPLIQPIYDTRSASEVLSGLFDEPVQATGAQTPTGSREPRDGYTILRQYWASRGYPIDQLDIDFNRLLHDGVIPNTAAKPLDVAFKPDGLAALAPTLPLATGASRMELVIRPDPTIWDGRYANNGWLQELPKPIIRTTWDNAALISPDTAKRLNIDINEPTLDHASAQPVIEITYNDRKITAPVWITPGHPDDSLTLHLGYGRTNVGEVGNNIGVDTYKLVRSDAPWGGLATVALSEDSYQIATTQFHHLMEGRDLVRSGTISQFIRRPDMAPEDEPTYDEAQSKETAKNDMGEGKNQPDVYPTRPWPETQAPNDRFGAYNWGMSIDIQSCIGCNACLMACQSENNIPVVGKQQVMVGHHMSWIRIDTYYKSDPDRPESYLQNPETYFQPVTCMQCEHAPCEPVCPVGATVHSEEGINQMVYNRCIGTRYCSNNCPYKVRRFNFLNYNNHFDIKSKVLVFNPEVTVRSRGVMEKCMYCIQRINMGRQKAKMEGRELHDGEVVTACQQACPTRAISFGNITDAATEVAKLKNQPHNYGLLADLNTRPRTTYLARVTNPNPDIEPETEQHGG